MNTYWQHNDDYNHMMTIINTYDNGDDINNFDENENEK